jgi:uncharacterized delta-60 repeat protein
VDSDGNFYISGQTASSGAGSYDALIIKYNKQGVVQWQRTLGGVGTDYGYSIAVDSSGNVYIAGEDGSTGGNTAIIIAKYNTSGTLQWQRRLSGGGSGASGLGIGVDSSGNAYVAGYSGTTGDFQIAKYNTSGSLQWQRRLYGSGMDQCRCIAIDSSGNAYVAGYTNSQSVAYTDFLLAKYDTSGTLQWQRRLGGSYDDQASGIAVDSSGNVYVTGLTSSVSANFSNPDVLIAKYDTSGTLQWQRYLGGSYDDRASGIAVDSSGNVYVKGRTNSPTSGGYNDALIAKYNTSGTLQWQRTLGGSFTEYGYGIAVDSAGDVYITGTTSSPGAGADQDLLFAKLPSDGSLTGTYTVGSGSIAYAASAFTDGTPSLTSAATSLTDAATSLTDAASTFTDAASNLTSTVVTL